MRRDQRRPEVPAAAWHLAHQAGRCGFLFWQSFFESFPTALQPRWHEPLPSLAFLSAGVFNSSRQFHCPVARPVSQVTQESLIKTQLGPCFLYPKLSSGFSLYLESEWLVVASVTATHLPTPLSSPRERPSSVFRITPGSFLPQGLCTWPLPRSGSPHLLHCHLFSKFECSLRNAFGNHFSFIIHIPVSGLSPL